jgi:hypothetical protein
LVMMTPLSARGIESRDALERCFAPKASFFLTHLFKPLQTNPRLEREVTNPMLWYAATPMMPWSVTGC